jgi:hypothetical protein
VKIIIVTLALSFSILGCKKETEPPLMVEVYDYLTGQPVEGAKVVSGHSYDFDLSCFCYAVNISMIHGYTNHEGKLGPLLDLDNLMIIKDTTYHTAAPYDDCYYELKNNTARYYLMKRGMFEITAVTNQSFYPIQPWLEVVPVLKNGALPKPWFGGDSYLSTINPFPRLGYAGLKNRIMVLYSPTSNRVDTLFKTEVFLEENTTKQIFINY